MGQGASVASIQWTEDSWNEAMKHESLGDTLSSSTSPLSDVAENLKRLDKLFLAQVANVIYIYIFMSFLCLCYIYDLYV